MDISVKKRFVGLVVEDHRVWDQFHGRHLGFGRGLGPPGRDLAETQAVGVGGNYNGPGRLFVQQFHRGDVCLWWGFAALMLCYRAKYRLPEI